MQFSWQPWPFSCKTKNDYLTYVTLQLQTHQDILLPSDDTLEKNNIIKLPNEEDPPVFIQLVKKELGLWCFPHCNMSFTGWSIVILLTRSHPRESQPLIGSLKSLLGNGAFDEYFTGSRDEPWDGPCVDCWNPSLSWHPPWSTLKARCTWAAKHGCSPEEIHSTIPSMWCKVSVVSKNFLCTE